MSMLSLFEYNLPWKDTFRQGLILQNGDKFSEIAPLKGFSKETLNEAKEETIQWIRNKKKPTLASVKWGLECLQSKLKSIHLPLCALGAKKNFPYVKIKLGNLNVDEAVNHVKSLLGKHKLRLDFNKTWDLSSAIEFTKHFSIDDFEYLEEPVKTFDELIEFSKKTHFPIAIDESIHEDWEKIPTLKTMVVKPTVVGFIPNFPSIVLSSAYESGLGLLHIANKANSNTPIGLDTYSSFKKDLLLNPIQTKNGFFSWEEKTPLLNKEHLTCVL